MDAAEQAAVVSEVAKRAPGTPLVVGVSARTTAVAIEQARTVVASAGSPRAPTYPSSEASAGSVCSTSWRPAQQGR